MSEPPAPDTVYDEWYFQRFYDPESGIPYERSAPWLKFFGTIADRIVRDIGPSSVLDAGCAMGLLVESLRDRGVDAHGIDLSEYAIGQVRDDIKPFCHLGSITDPFPRQYDLIVTIETLEHLDPADAERAVDNICAHTSDVLFSSTPHHYREPTHLNVQPPGHWAELFARNGLYRDTGYDLSTYVAPWAMGFRRSSEPVSRTIAGYEHLNWRLKHEVVELREAVNANRQEIITAEERAAVAARRADEAERRADEAERRADEAEPAFREVELELTAIRASHAYRLSTRLRAVARGVLPLSSRRGRALTWLMTKARRPPSEGTVFRAL